MANPPVLDYSKQGRSRSVRIARGLALLFAALALFLGANEIMYRYHQRDVDNMHKEKDCFEALGAMATDMIANHAAGVGVSEATGHPIITTFDSLFDYVAARRPDLVSKREAPNPFPGLLPPGDYGRANASARQDDDLLIWSKNIYRGGNRIQVRLSCDGLVRTILHGSPVVGG